MSDTIKRYKLGTWRLEPDQAGWLVTYEDHAAALHACQQAHQTAQEALRALLSCVQYLDDQGPSGESWQSDELMAAIANARAALTETRP